MTMQYEAWAETYDELAGDVSRATWDAGIATELARLARGPATVLDLGAGTGIGSVVLGRTLPELVVTSLDRSPEMLDRGGVPPDRRVVADMADFTVPGGTFDFVVSGFDSMNYLPPPQLAACLSRAAHALRPGGALVFDYCSRRFLSQERPDARDLLVGDLRLQRRWTFERSLDRCTTDLSLFRGAVLLWQETHRHHVVDPFTMDDLARDAGLETVLVRDLDGWGFSPLAAQHVYVLHKP